MEPRRGAIWRVIKTQPTNVVFRLHEPEALVLKSRCLALLRARAQSVEADGARARNRTGLVEHDYEQEHERENAMEKIESGSETLEHRYFKRR